EEAAAAERKAREDAAEAARQRAIGNLEHLEPAEYDALWYILSQEGHRARASINSTSIFGLYNMGLLIREDRSQLPTDAIWSIPEDLIEAIQEVFGEPDPKERRRTPPWRSR